MTKVEIWHNPRCSKSRQTLKLLEEREIEPDVILYLETPPGKDRLGEVLAMLDLEPRDLMRRKESAYRENGLGDEALSRDQLIGAMTENPILIERPVVISGMKAAIGRPPESVLDIL